MEKKFVVEDVSEVAYGSVKLAKYLQEEAKGTKSLPSSVSVDEIHGSVNLAKDPLKDSQEIQSLLQSLLATVSFSRFDGFKHSHPSYVDGFECSLDVPNDFIVSQAANADWPIRAESQLFPEIVEPHPMFENVALCLAKAFLAYLVEGFSKPSFQAELQKLLMSARTFQKPGTESKKVVPGRCALSQLVEEKALAKIGFAKTATVRAWKLVSLFLHEEKVLAQLCLLDELLALPPSSNLNAVLHCGDRC